MPLAGPNQKTQEPSSAPHLQQDANPPTQDASLGTSSAASAGSGALGASATSPVTPSFTPPVPHQTSQKSGSSANKKVLIIPLAILLIAAVSFGGYYYYTNIYSKSQKEKATIESELDEERDLGSISATPSPKPSPKPEDNIYVNSSLGFSFEAPEGWQRVDVISGIVNYRNSEPEFDTSNNLYQSNLNMVTHELAAETTLEAYSESNKNDRLAKFQNYQLLGSANDSMAGIPAIIDDYLILIDSTTVRQRQVYTIHNGRGYIFTFSTLPESWEKHLPTFDDVRNSFTFSGAVSGARIGI